MPTWIGSVRMEQAEMTYGGGRGWLTTRSLARGFACSGTPSVANTVLPATATAYVVGAIIGHVVVPAFDSGRVAIGALVAGAAAILGVSLGKVLALFGRRLGAGAMQFRLQATY